MLFYHYRLFITVIILTIISFIFLHKKIKRKKVTLVTSLVTIIFVVFMIIIINRDFINLISKEFADNISKIDKYFNVIVDFNVTFFITSLIITGILFILFKKIKYSLLYILTIFSLILGSTLLFCFKGFIVTKNVINFGMLAQCLSFYYIYMCTIPLLIIKLKEKN